uniref:Uncharacterized protein n=1 Tax=Glossina palpalis gambiensis TaxID=67801 RepID=A0A1B0ANR3_9MUSC
MCMKFLALVSEELGELAKRYQWCLLGGLEGLQACWLASNSFQRMSCDAFVFNMPGFDATRVPFVTARMDANAEKCNFGS